MPYTEAVIWEVWRHATIVPIGVDRMSRVDVDLGGFLIPKVDMINWEIPALLCDLRPLALLIICLYRKLKSAFLSSSGHHIGNAGLHDSPRSKELQQPGIVSS
jgi:hypothetical protein